MLIIDSCKLYSSYCSNTSHSDDCHTIMEKYYGQSYYEKRYYICQKCETISLGDYINFYTQHAQHLNQFKGTKKDLFKNIKENVSYCPPTKKIKQDIYIELSDDEDNVIDDWEKFNRINNDLPFAVENDVDCAILVEDDEDCRIVEKTIVDEEWERFNRINEDGGEWDNFKIVEELDIDSSNKIINQVNREDVMVGGSLNADNLSEIEIETDLYRCHQILKMDVTRWDTNEIVLPKVLIDKLVTIITELKNVKIQFGVMVEFIKEDEVKTCRLSNRAVPLSDDFFEEGIKKLNEKICIRSELGSSWTLNKILEINFKITKVTDISRLSGCSYIKTPTSLRNKGAIVNIENTDNKCFLYSVLAVIKKDQVDENHRSRPLQYQRFMSEVRYNEKDMPMKLKDIPKFEQLNAGLSINVLSWNNTPDKDDVDIVMKHPNLDIIHKSKVVGGEKIYLLLLQEGDKYHYTGVLNLNRLMNRDVKMNGVQIRSIWCPNCLNGFRLQETFDKHVTICDRIQTGTTQYTMPTDTKLEFKDYRKTITPPFVIYADFESVLPSDDKYFQKHLPVSAGLLLVNNFTNKTEYRQFIGDECVFEFLKAVEDISENIVFPYYNENGKKKMVITRSEQLSFDAATICHLCRKPLRKPVRDHDHFTGEYKGAACSKCNLSRQINIQLPVVFHNLRGYDLHHILKFGINRFPQWTISCIPSTTEKFLCLMVRQGNTTIRFIDSYQFINSSLDAAVKSLKETPLTKKEFNDDRIQMSKGIFPYNYATSLQVLVDTTSMPPRWEDISEEDYNKAVEMWTITGCNTLLDYMMLYLKLDVFLLADFFQQFRAKSLAHNNLEPLTFFGIPGMSWASALMSLDEPIELLSDNDMYTFFEGGIRGGLTFVNKHHVTSNDNTDLLYIDINNLYGWALSQKLPYGELEWVYTGLDSVLEECVSGDLDSLPYGYTLEVDMEIPSEIQDYLNDLPVAAEHQSPPGSRVKKLLLTHHPKNNYVIHWRLLQLYIKLGVQVTNVHRGVRFKQGNIFQKYIDINTKLRSECTTELEKNFYKLLNNSLYGKTVENLKKRINLRLCNSAKKLLTYTSKAGFRKSMKIADDLIAVLLNKESVCLDRPSYIGQTVLDLSKLRMYQLQYVELEKYRREENCQINIVAGDTDSFFLEIIDISLEKLTGLMVRDQLLDTSNYNINHPLYSNHLNSVIGKFKDESKGSRYVEWLFLRPKCYSLLSEKSSMRAKGITLKNTGINHQTYVDCYENLVPVSVEQFRIASKNHTLYSIKNKKVALSNNDDKRVWTGPNTSVPYGYYAISDI